MCGGICKVGTFHLILHSKFQRKVGLDFLTFFSYLPISFSLLRHSFFTFFFPVSQCAFSAHFLSSCSLKLSSHVMLFLIFCSHDHDLQWSSPSFIFYYSFSRPWSSPSSFFSFSFFHSHAFFELSSHLHLLWFEIWDLRFQITERWSRLRIGLGELFLFFEI